MERENEHGGSPGPHALPALTRRPSFLLRVCAPRSLGGDEAGTAWAYGGGQGSGSGKHENIACHSDIYKRREISGLELYQKHHHSTHRDVSSLCDLKHYALVSSRWLPMPPRLPRCFGAPTVALDSPRISIVIPSQALAPLNAVFHAKQRRRRDLSQGTEDHTRRSPSSTAT